MYYTAAELSEKMPDASYLLSDEPEMESSLHYLQLLLLVTALDWLWQEKTDYFIGANLTIYYSRQQLKNREFRGPDFFLVKEVSNHPRPSWVLWEEGGKYPNLIIELLSESTANVDRTLKKKLYQDRFRTPEYFWFSPDSLEFKGFRLTGNHYQEIETNSQGWRWSEELGLYLGIYETQLRYFTPEGELVPTPKEAAIREKLEKEREKLMRQQVQGELEAEKQRVAHLEQRLRELGFNLDQ